MLRPRRVVYYETREERLGARLIQEFDEAVAVALEYPEAFATLPEAPVDFGLRWVVLRTSDQGTRLHQG